MKYFYHVSAGTYLLYVIFFHLYHDVRRFRLLAIFTN